MSTPVSYLPPGLVDSIRYAKHLSTVTGDQRWELNRLVERAFAEGYEMGHARGYQDGYNNGRARLQVKDDEAENDGDLQ